MDILEVEEIRECNYTQANKYLKEGFSILLIRKLTQQGEDKLIYVLGK